MNTKDNWLTTARIHEQHRRAVWGTIFQDAVVPIKSILPARADLPGHTQAEIYMLDLDAISEEQKEQLVDMVHKLFGLARDEIRADMTARGVPILAEGVTVVTRDQGLMLSMLPDYDDVLARWQRRDNDDPDVA